MTFAPPVELSQPQQVQANDAVISARHLTKMFGEETAVQDVSFDVPRSSIFGFIGPTPQGVRHHAYGGDMVDFRRFMNGKLEANRATRSGRGAIHRCPVSLAG